MHSTGGPLLVLVNWMFPAFASLLLFTHTGAPPIAKLQEIAKRMIFNVQNEMAVCQCRATRVREANYVQCAEQLGVPPPHELQGFARFNVKFLNCHADLGLLT